MNDDEFALFTRLVERSGLSYAAYLRHLAAGARPQDKPPPEYFDIKKEIRAIGNNMNQIAMIANATGIIDAAKYDERYRLLIRNLIRITEEIEMPKEMI
jgi:hypothetical protein